MMTWYPVTQTVFGGGIAIRQAKRDAGCTHDTEEEAEEEVVRRNVTWLLEHLFMPDAEVGACYTGQRVKLPGTTWVDVDEAINWGDIGVRECEKHGDHWHVVLEEADPGCVSLRYYVSEWMRVWGWACEVRAEW